MAEKKTIPTRDEKMVALWATLKVQPDEYEIRTAMPDGVPVQRRFVGHDLPRCIELWERSLAKWPDNAFDTATLERMRTQVKGTNDG